VAAVEAAVGHPDMVKFWKATNGARILAKTEALAAARELDSKIESLLRESAI
jgi:hypothetical protein